MIARKSLLVFANNVAGALLGILAIKVTSVYLGPEIIGEFDAALGFLGLLFFLTDLGFGNAHMKRVSEGMDPGDCLATFAVFKAVVTGAFVAVALSALFVRLVVLGKPLEDATPVTLLVVLAYLAVKSLTAIPGSTFDARRETARGQLMLFVETAVRVVVTIPVALVIAAGLREAGPLVEAGVETVRGVAWMRAHPAAAYGAAWLVGAVASLVVGLLYLPRSTRMGRFRADILRSYWVYALPIFLVATIHVISTYIDRAAIAYFWSDVEVGRFAHPRRITAFFEAIPAAVVLLLFPTISSLHAERRLDEIGETTSRAERYVSMVVFPVVAAVIVYAEAVIRVALSAEWIPAVWTLRWLAVYSLFIALTRPSVAVLLGVDRPGVAARVGLGMTASNIALVLLLVPPPLQAIPVPLPGLGALGAAVATALSGAIGFVMFRRAAAGILGPRPWGYLVKHAAAALVAAAAMAALATLPDGPMRAWHLVLFSAAGALVYAAGLALLGELTREDLRWFRGLAHPGDMGRYLRDELRRQ